MGDVATNETLPATKRVSGGGLRSRKTKSLKKETAFVDSHAPTMNGHGKAALSPEDAKATAERKEDQRMKMEAMLNSVSLAIVLLIVGRFAFGWLAFAFVVAAGINHRLRQNDAQQRRDRHRIHRAANYRIREVMPHPPNWIRYSEKERVLFLTNLIKVLWPFMRASIEQTVKLAIETYFRLNKPGFLSEIVVTNVNFGMRAPVVAAADVQQGTSHVIIDLDLNWAAEDFEIAIEARTRLLKLPVKITEFKLMGTLRFMLAPVIDTGPYVKAMTFSFLKPPNLNYGSLQAVFIPLSRIPGLANFIHEAINGGLVAFTWPSTMPIPFVDMSAAELAAIARRAPSGLLRVKVLKASNLRGVDLNGKSTPYVTAQLGTQRHACKPKKSTIAPVWNYACEFIVHDKDTDTLDIHVMDSDKVGKDELLGRVQFDLSEISPGRHSITHALTDPGSRKKKGRVTKRPEMELILEYLPFHTKTTPYTEAEANDAVDPTWASETDEAKPRGMLQKFDVFSTQPTNGKLFLVVKNLWCVPPNTTKPVEVVIKFGDVSDDIDERAGLAQYGPPVHQTYAYVPFQMRGQDVAYYPNSPNQAHHLMVAYEETVCLPVGNVHTDKLAVFVKGLPKQPGARSDILKYTCSISDKLKDGARMSILQINDGSSQWDNAPESEVQLELTMTLLYGVRDEKLAEKLVAEPSSPNGTSRANSPSGGDSETGSVVNNPVRLGHASKRTRDEIQTVAEQSSAENDEKYKDLPQELPMKKMMIVTGGCYFVVYLSGYFFGWGILSWIIAAGTMYFYGQSMLGHHKAVRALEKSPNASWVRRIKKIEAEMAAPDAETSKVQQLAGDKAALTPANETAMEAGEKYCDTLGQARVSQELPRWVKSPAVEKVTWLNEILEALWPKIKKGITTQVRDQVETQLTKLREDKPFLKNLLIDMEEFELGELPLLVDGVQHYDNQLEGDRIHLDFDLRMATNLAVAVRVGLNRMFSTAIAVRNIGFEGTLRVELSPLVPIIPCFGNMSVCFMDIPKIDFDVYLGDYSLLATPLLWANAKQFMDDQIRDMIVFPNKITVPVLSEEQLRSKAKAPGAGILRIHLESARGLRNADLIGKSDPMVVMVLHDEEHEQTLTSSVRHNDLNPDWDEMFEFVVANPNANFEFHIYDVDDDMVTSKVIGSEAGGGLFGKDHLGSASMPFQDFLPDAPMRHSLPLRTARKKPAGSLTVTSTWKPFIENPTDTDWALVDTHCQKARQTAQDGAGGGLDTADRDGTMVSPDEEEDEVHPASIGVLYCTIRTVEDLDPRADKVRGMINSQQQTIDLKNASGVLNSHLRLGLLVENPKYDKFVLEILNSSGDVLGAITKPVSEFSDGKVSNRMYAVEGSRGNVMLQTALRVTNPLSKELMIFHHGMKAVGVLRVKVVRAEGLRNVERFSKSDPYVLMSFQESTETERTSHVPNNLNPEWNSIFEFPLSTKTDVITFTVKDYEDAQLGVKVTKEKVLGIDVQHIAALPKDTLVKREYFLRGSASSRVAKGSLFVELEWKEFSEEIEEAVMENTSKIAASQATLYKTLGWNSVSLFGRLISMADLPIKKPRITITSATGNGPTETVLEFVLPAASSHEHLAMPFSIMLPSVDCTITFIVTDASKSRDHSNRGICQLKLSEFLGTFQKPREFKQMLKWTGGSNPPLVEFVADLLVKNLGLDRVGEIGVEDTLALPGTINITDADEEAAGGRESVDGVDPLPMYPNEPGHLKFEVIRLRGFDSAPGGSEPNVYVSARINARRRGSHEHHHQKQKTEAVKSANPRFTKNNIFDFTVNNVKDEYIEIHAKSQESLLGSFRHKGRLAELHIPVTQIKIGGDYTPGPASMEQEFMFETGKMSGYIILKVVEWLPASLTSAAAGAGVADSPPRDSSAALKDDTISMSSRSSNASPFKSPRGSRKSNLSRNSDRGMTEEEML
eukprot:m.159557 g.159557  ORF g.159557 m.159557 type:complete len:1946 (+) comp11810_c0_seq1:1939-7776(+)